jgi:hypothetical protein
MAGLRDPERWRRGGERRVRKVLRAVGMEPSIGGLDPRFVEHHRWRLDRRRAMGPPDLEELARLLGSADAVVPLREAATLRRGTVRRLVGLRHDMDQDVDNAVRFAAWEATHGWRATYFVLHTEWYWRAPGAAEPSRLVLKALDRIASLGHEIGLHNNVLAAALRTGEEPQAILERELAALRRHGFEVVGVARHGDRLCRPLGFLNDDLFVDSSVADTRERTGERAIEATDPPEPLAVEQLRYRPMTLADVGLTYDAYRLGHSLYETDTGGRWAGPLPVTAERFAADGGFLQLLAHPLWYALHGEPYAHRPARPEAAPAPVAEA